MVIDSEMNLLVQTFESADNASAEDSAASDQLGNDLNVNAEGDFETAILYPASDVLVPYVQSFLQWRLQVAQNLEL